MSFRNISLENYSYEMLKTHYHELFITTRTSIQDPSIRPQGGSRSNTFFITKQGEHEGEEGFWVEDEEGLEGFMSKNDEETFWVLEENDAFIARKVSGRNFRFKKRKGKGKSGNKKGSHQRGGFKPFRKAVLAGRPIWPMRTMIPTTRHIGEKAKERRERKENQNSNIPMMETRVIHFMRMAKEKGGMTRENPRRSQHRKEDGGAADCAIHRAYLCRLDRPRLGSIMDIEQGWYSSYETSSAGQALMAFHDAYEHHEKEAIHGKLIQSDAVSEHNLSVATNHSLLATKLMAPVINPQHNPSIPPRSDS